MLALKDPIAKFGKVIADDGEGSTLDNLTPEDYEAASEEAKAAGFDVLIANDYLLLLDLDNQNARNTLAKSIELVDRMFGVIEVKEWVSKSGGEHSHASVALRDPLKQEARIALQAALGSDPTREILSLIRLRNGVVEPSRLFKVREKV